MTIRIFCFLLVAGCADSGPYIPEKVNLSSYNYSKYLDSLEDARSRHDFYSEGIALANLNAPARIVKEAIIKGIIRDSIVCFSVLRLDSLLKLDGFETNLYKNSPENWQEYFKICNTKISNADKLRVKEAELILIETRKERIRSSIDSSIINTELIELLKVVHENDQEYRRIGIIGNPQLASKQRKRDSLNFVLLDSIFVTYGFPDLATIGEDNMETIWLVGHHQTIYKHRMRFDSILYSQHQKGNISEFALNSFRERTKSMFSD